MPQRSKKRRLPNVPKLGRRGTKSRTPEYVIRIFCEGATEEHYLNWLAQKTRRTGVDVKVVGRQGVPKTVAQKAAEAIRELRHEARKRRGLADLFEVWAVCDRDIHDSFDAAASQCADNSIGFAWSNPCVELWGLLHFIDQTAHIERDKCQKELTKYMPSYHHDKSPYFELRLMTDESHEDARRRAIHLHRRARDAGHPRGNPTTALWKLVDVLLYGNSSAARTHARERDDGSAEWWLDVDPGT